MRRLLFLIGLCLLCGPVSLVAQAPCTSPSPQTTPPTYNCKTGTAHTAQFDYTGLQPGDMFRMIVNNAPSGPDVPAANGTVSLQFGATLAAGTYTVEVAAVRPGATPPEVKSAAVRMILTAPVAVPPAPSNFRILS